MQRWKKVDWVRVGFLALLILAACAVAVRNIAPIDLDFSAEAWAAWVQAILTVTTFAGTVWYQAIQTNRANARADEAVHRLELAHIQEEMLKYTRHLRRFIAIAQTYEAKDKSTLLNKFHAHLYFHAELKALRSPELQVSKLGRLSTLFAVHIDEMNAAVEFDPFEGKDLSHVTEQFLESINAAVNLDALEISIKKIKESSLSSLQKATGLLQDDKTND